MISVDAIIVGGCVGLGVAVFVVSWFVRKEMSSTPDSLSSMNLAAEVLRHRNAREKGNPIVIERDGEKRLSEVALKHPAKYAERGR